MCNLNRNRLQVLANELAVTMKRLIAQGSQMYALRAEVRAQACEYPELIIWLPELRGDQVVVDIWDLSWKPLACVSVQASQEMQNAPMW